MQASLQHLAQREAELLAAFPTGSYVEDRLPLIERAGFTEKWAAIFAGYVGLLDDPIEGLEALRRATFLAWYPWNEPYFLTGIKPFDDASVQRVFQRVDAQLSTPEGDQELRAMLRGYGPGLPFDRYSELRNLASYLSTIAGPYSPDRPLGPMAGRGAMGHYWASRQDAA